MKLTQQDFELFQYECEKWLKRLGLQSWKVYFGFADTGDSLATCATNYKGRNSTISLNKNQKFDKEIIWDKEKNIKANALHECLELLLSPLRALASDRGWDETEYEKEHHSIIRTLENLLE